jgi:hypothetical protein
MTPLYIGKTASFIIQAKDMGQQEAEAESKTVYGILRTTRVSGKQLEILDRRCTVADFLELILEPLKGLVSKFNAFVPNLLRCW